MREVERYFLENFDYIHEDKFYEIIRSFYENGYRDDLFSDEDIAILVMRGSHVGDLLRIAYYKYVHKLGFDPRAYWDAVVRVFMLGRIFRYDLEQLRSEKRIKDTIKRTRYPKWSEWGLFGNCGLSQIKKMGNEFCEFLDSLGEE